jgi:isochorismate synthase
VTPTSFVLSGPAGTVVADGIATGYADAADAAAALRDGGDVVVGALPFDLRTPPRCWRRCR